MTLTNDTNSGAQEVRWDLSDLYKGADDAQLESDQQKVLDEAEQFAAAYHGKINNLDAEEFHQALEEYEEILDLLGKIGSFAHLLWSTDTNNPAYGKLMQQANELSSAVHQKLVFFDVEWLDLSEEKAEQLINNETLSHYRHYLETSRRYKEHTLSEKEEQILSAKSVTGSSAWNRFFDESMGAARYEIDGKTLTQQEALSKLHDPDRDLRKRAQQALTSTFTDMSRSLTFVFNTILADKNTNDSLRNYPGWLTSRNLSNEIEDDTVDTLINSVTENYNLVQRFYRLKKKLLGYDTLYDYDRYAPLLENKKQVQWNEARSMVLNSYGEFHSTMGDVAGKFFENNWIDAAIEPGKRGGAYSAGTVPSVHPYVFMNYDGQVRDVQTLAHELGHGVHQYLSREQGVLQSGTPLTTAETASVFGEMLVFQNLMEQLDDPREQLALLIGKIDDSIATVFRQVSMNQFEDAIHTARREEGELTTEEFSTLWRQSQEPLYGDAVELTQNYDIWWSYIPHFLHSPGYVYAYAFGELLVLALYDEYTRSKNGFSEKYVNMLRTGGADWPENIVAKVGLDITQADFWEKGLSAIGKMIDEAEQLASKIDQAE